MTTTLPADCSTLEAMAKRFEDTAALMLRLDEAGFALK